MFKKSRKNKAWFGVIAGLAKETNMDITALRMLTLVIGLITGVLPALAVYLILAAIMPEEE